MRAISVPALALLLAAAACGGTSQYDYPYPDTISGYFTEEKLKRVTHWVNGGTSAAVYIRQDDEMPNAALQIGIMVSYDRPNPERLAEWIETQSAVAESRIYRDDNPDEACVVARDKGTQRLYIAIHACKADDERSVCVQLDETYDKKYLSNCDQNCHRVSCERMWADWGEEVDWLAADVLERK
jgi:hypothetical protein